MAEVFLGSGTRQVRHPPGDGFGFVRARPQAITALINGGKERCRPFIGATDADAIVAADRRQSTSGAWR